MDFEKAQREALKVERKIFANLISNALSLFHEPVLVNDAELSHTGVSYRRSAFTSVFTTDY